MGGELTKAVGTKNSSYSINTRVKGSEGSEWVWINSEGFTSVMQDNPSRTRQPTRRATAYINICSPPKTLIRLWIRSWVVKKDEAPFCSSCISCACWVVRWFVKPWSNWMQSRVAVAKRGIVMVTSGLRFRMMQVVYWAEKLGITENIPFERRSRTWLQEQIIEVVVHGGLAVEWPMEVKKGLGK